MITLTEKAQKAVQRFIRGAEKPMVGVRFAVVDGGCSGFEYKIGLEETTTEEDTLFASGPVTVIVDNKSKPYLEGVVVDFYDGLTESGFRFQNPNAKSSCGCGSSFNV